jgi:23S rRNA (cytosine1962-C5)-methyltransferase
MKQLIIKKGKEKAMFNRHPWVFSGAVAQLPQAENGEIVEVREADKKLLGYGFFSPKSQIVCRIFEFVTTEKNIDTAYWHDKLASAFELRKNYVIAKNTNSYRLLHAEGDFFPGVIADVYADTVVLQLLIKGTERIVDIIAEGLKKLGYRYIYIKNKDVSHFLEEIEIKSGWVGEKGNEQITILENGVKFAVNIETGQKTGFFLDQRESRELLALYSKDKKVLNTFSYSGGFSMYALQAGASLVHSVDSSQIAIDLCDENVLLNQYDTAKHQSYCADCFDFLKNMPTDYDVIVLDPPAFAKNAKSVPNATRGYKELNLLAIKKIKPGGIIFTFSCSQKIEKDLFRKVVFGAAADARRNVRILHQTTQPIDHPINIFHPENEYLKGLVLYVE